MSTPQRRHLSVLTFSLFVLVLFTAASAVAQTVMTLAPGFHPQSLSGIAGGPQHAAANLDHDGQPCPGWIAHTANHQIDLVGPIAMTIAVESPVDTTLAIWGPDGWRCSDDANGYNPAITDILGVGSYSIFVGTYDEGASAPYTLHLTEGHAPTAAEAGSSDSPGGVDVSSSTSTYDSIVLAAGFVPDPQTLLGTAGGDADAGILGPTPTGSCVGWVSETPDHIMTLNTGFEFLRVTISSAEDTTLAVFGPTGWHCNDDTHDVNPEVALHGWPPGVYRIWVGSYDRGMYWPYEIYFSEYMSAQPVPVPALELTFQGAFEEIDVFFSGPDAATIFAECMGYLGSANTSLVDDVTIFGVAHHNRPSYWGDEVLCAMAAANARPRVGDCPYVVAGSIEDLPFAFCGVYIDEIRHAVTTYAPVLASNGMIDDLVIDGVPHHNGPSYWNADQVTSMILSTVVDPMAGLVARGDIEGSPFVFSGNTAAEIRSQCEAFVHSMSLSLVDDINVNGEHRHNGPSYWNAAEICMIISSMAR